MSIGAIGAGISALFNVIQGVASPQAATTPTTTTTPVAGAAPTQVFPRGLQWQLKQKIQTAVTAALQDPANAAANPNTVIQQAIAGVLQGNGAATAASTVDPGTAAGQFAALLTAKGVDPSQFQADFNASLEQSTVTSGGTLDYSKIFQTVPTGTTLNTVG